MPFIYDAPVFQLVYNLLKEVHVARRKFAKTERYTLGESIARSLLSLLLAIIDAGQKKNEWKVAAIDTALTQLEQTKVLIRLANDINQIYEAQYLQWEEVLQRIGRMLGGWRKKI